jgi:hypothetical protein
MKLFGALGKQKNGTKDLECSIYNRMLVIMARVGG